MSALDSLVNAVTGAQPRGLHNFISEIRNLDDKSLEIQRVDKELGNIRAKFSNPAPLSSYNKKKYVWKLCYIYMLGYEVDFGHIEICSLLNTKNFQEKTVGYMAVGLLIRPGDELMNLVVQSIKADLQSSQVQVRTLALSAIANIGGEELAAGLASEVRRVITELMAASRPPYIQYNAAGAPLSQEEIGRHTSAIYKKSCLATLRMYRAMPEIIAPAEWVPLLITLLEDKNVGVVACTMSLINGLASHSQSDYELLLPYVINAMTKLYDTSPTEVDLGYVYYRINAPWLQVRCLRFLQYFKEPEGHSWDKLSAVLLRILAVRDTNMDSVNVQNCNYALIFEAVGLVVSWGRCDHGSDHFELREMTHTLLGRLIGVSDANVKYLALDMLARVCKVDGVDAAMQATSSTVVASLGDADMSVRKRALEVIFLITDRQNSSSMVADLVTALSTADETLREDMVVKIAILAERFYENIRWYVDTMIEVIVVAGEHVAEAVWYRIVQTVINNEDVHEYAAQKLFNSVQSKFCHEVCVCLAAYLLGEVGFFICDKPGCSGFEQFAALHQHFDLVSSTSKSLLLTCYIKLANQYPDVEDNVQAIFAKLSSNTDVDLQQRACEYAALPQQGPEIMQAILERMPNWAEKEINVLQSIAEEKEAAIDTADKQATKVSSTEKEASRRASLAQATMSPATFNNKNRSFFGGPDEAVQRGHDALNYSDNGNNSDDDNNNNNNSDNNRGSGSSSSGTPSPPKPSKPQRPVSVDLLNMADESVNDALVQARGELTAEEKVQVAKLFKRALIAGPVKSILFENETVSVDCLADYRGAQGRLTVTLYNKGDFELSGASFEVPESSYDGDCIAVRLKPPAGNRVPSMDELKLQVAVAARRPFESGMERAPLCTVRYILSGVSYTVPVHLPLALVSFCEAPDAALSKDAYMAQWRALDPGQGHQEQAVFAIGAALGSISDIMLDKLRSNLFPKLHLGIVEGIDTANSVTAATTFKTTTPGPGGAPLSVEALLRMEADRAGNRFRLTVRAKHPKVAQAVYHCLQEQLS